MASRSNSSSTKDASSRPSLRVLMLHGFFQSGPLFRVKSAALAKHLHKSFPLHEISLSYPTGPLRLSAPDLPGYSPANESRKDEEEIDSYAWWRHRDGSSPPEYLGLESGLNAIAQVLHDEGPFDGVMGFSQGASMAAMVASLLEPGRADAFAYFATSATEASHEIPTAGIPFPSSFSPPHLSHPPLKFAICYSGFRSPGARYRGFYENPSIQTPVLHVLGSLDTIVEESRSRLLIEVCQGDPEEEGRVIWHPGGHFLPSQRAFLDAPISFIRKCLGGIVDNSQNDGAEDNVEDMELPF